MKQPRKVRHDEGYHSTRKGAKDIKREVHFKVSPGGAFFVSLFSLSLFKFDGRFMGKSQGKRIEAARIAAVLSEKRLQTLRGQAHGIPYMPGAI
jgi:hypothetical protein